MSGPPDTTEAARLRAFLDESLALWQVAGTVHSGDEPVIAEIHAAGGAVAWVVLERA